MIALLGFTQALVFIAVLARWKVVALVLGPEGVGLASVIDQIAQVALNVGSLSIPVAALRFLSVIGPDRAGAWARLYRALLRAILILTSVVAGLTGLTVMLLPGILTDELQQHVPALVLALAAVPMTAATALSKGSLASVGRYYRAAVITFLGSAILVPGVYVGVQLYGLTGLYLAVLVFAVLVFAVLRGAIGRVMVGNRTSAFSVRTLVREHPEILRFCGAMYTVSFATAGMYALARYRVLDRFGAEMAGFVAAAYAIGMAVRLIFGEASVQYLIPSVSRRDKGRDRGREVDTFVRNLSILLAIAALPVMLFPAEALAALYSGGFVSAAGFLWLFVLSEAIVALAEAYRAALVGFDDPIGYAGNTLLGIAVVVAGVVFILPRYGPPGLGVSHLAGAMIMLVANMARLGWSHGLYPTQRSLIVMTVGLLVLVGAGLVGLATSMAGVTAWVWKGAACLGVVGGLVALMPTADRERLPGIRWLLNRRAPHR